MNTSTERIKNNKYFDHELNFIISLCLLNSSEIRIVEHEDAKANISKKQGTFDVEIQARLVEDNNDEDNFLFILNNEIYETKKIWRYIE